MSNQYSPYGTYYSPQQRQPPPEPIDKRAIAALGLGIGSIVLSCCAVPGAVMGVFAVINGLNAAQSDNPTNKFMGIAGIACGVIGVLLSAAALIVNMILIANDPNFRFR